MDAPVSNYCRSKETVNNKTKTSAESFYFCQKMEFRTYILRIFIHSLVNSKSNELPQSLGGRWCFLLLLSSPFLFFLGFKVIFKIFKLCGMAKQTNKQTNKMEFWLFPGFRHILQYLHTCCFLYNCIYFFAPYFPLRS